MNRLLLGTALAALGAFSAQAADLAVRRAPAPMNYPVEQPYYWSGFYVGGNAGYTWSNQNGVDLLPTSGGPVDILGPGQLANSIDFSRNGFIGGGQIGYNWQFANWLVGFETDFQGTTVNSSALVHTNAAPLFPVDNSVSSKLDYFGTVRGRIGYLPQANWLVFLTGGLAYGEVNNSATVFDFGGNGVAPISWSGSSRTTQTGWTLGGGTEWAFTRNWSAKVEYLYYDLGKTNVTMSQVAGDPGFAGTLNARFANSGSIVRGGINYHF